MASRMLKQKVLIADRHPVARAGLQTAVHHALPGSTVVGVATLAEAEVAITRPEQFRMAICDPDLPDTTGLSGLLRLQDKLPSVPIVLLLARDNSTLVGTARSLGAAGILLKSASLDCISSDLREIVAGKPVFPLHFAGADTLPLRAEIAGLTNAQRKVLFTIAFGLANKRIAHDLAITEATVKAHLTAIFRRLNVTNRLELMIRLQPILGDVLQQSRKIRLEPEQSAALANYSG